MLVISIRCLVGAEFWVGQASGIGMDMGRDCGYQVSGNALID
jgi:hypothetical protein